MSNKIRGTVIVGLFVAVAALAGCKSSDTTPRDYTPTLARFFLETNDSGASTVVLRPADAQKLGIDTEKLRYSVPVQTANGTTYAAAVKLKRVAVGGIHFTEIDALVAKPGALRDSLLGMSFLNRLKSYEFSGDMLTLRI